MIRFETFAGLSNRMRALDSALYLAHCLGRKVELVWRIDNNFNCRFDDLFRIPDLVSTIEHPDFRSPLRRISNRTARILNRIRFDKCLYQDEVLRLHAEKYDFRQLGKYTKIFISTHTRFSGGQPVFFKLQPLDSLQSIIDSYIAGFDNVVGVHIRRTDNQHSVLGSPTARFIERMHHELELHPTVQFFLATDSAEEENHMLKEFPDRIILHRKESLDRGNPQAIKDALVDLYCLAGTRKILGSYWSSFTDLAAHMGEVEKEVVRAESRD